MHNAHCAVKSKRTSEKRNLHIMDFDSRPEPAKRLEQARVKRGFKTPKEAATFFGWKYETYIQHEQGHRGLARSSTRYAQAFKISEAWLLTGQGSPDAHVPADPDFQTLGRIYQGLTDTGQKALLQIARSLEAAQPDQQGRDGSAD